MIKVLIMPNNSESKCYFVQLQIDGYIDGDLEESQRTVFMSHVQDCAACAKEFRYAQMVQDTVLELPQIDCDEQVLEPIHRLSGVHAVAALGHEAGLTTQSPLSQFKHWLESGWFNRTPLFFRYSFPIALVAILVLAVNSILLTPDQAPVLSAEQIAPELPDQFSPEELSQALQELNLAIDYLNQVSRRTEVMIGDRFLVTPLQDSLNASFERANIRERDPLQSDPI